MHRWLGLRPRLVLLVLLALLPVFGLLAYSASQSRKAAFQAAESSLQSRVLLVAAHQQRLVEMVDELLKGIASAPYFKDSVPHLCGQHLKNLAAGRPEFNNIGVVGLDGKLVCDLFGQDGTVQYGDRPYFRQVLAGQPFTVGQVRIGRGSGLPGIPFAMPLHNDAGQLSGVAVAVVGLRGLSMPLGTVPTLQGARLTVLDSSGTVVAVQPPEPSLLGKPHPDAAVQQAIKKRLQGVMNAGDAQAAQQIYAFAPVPGGGADGFFVAISLPHELVAAHSRDAFGIELMALLAMMVFGMACAWWMGNALIVNPARALLKGADEVAKGKLEARVKVGSSQAGELGEIARSFNRMAESLQTQRKELDAALHQADEARILKDLILNSMNEGVVAVDAEGQFVLFNAAARNLYAGAPCNGASFDSWCRDHELRTLDGTVCPSSERPLVQAMHGAQVEGRDWLLRSAGVEDRIMRISARPLRDAQKQLVGALAILTEVTELKAVEGFAAAQEQVLALIAGGALLSQSLNAIVRLVERNAPGSLCSVLLVEGQQLRQSTAPSLPENFAAAIDNLPIAEGVGACGTAAFRKEQVVVEDVESDPLMRDYLPLLLRHELRACWATPVMSSDGDVLATIAIYRHKTGRPQARELELLAAVTRLARIALERARAGAALVSTEARFRELAENVEDMFYNRDLASGRYLYISPAYETLWQRSLESVYTDPGSCLHAIHTDDQPAVADSKKGHARGQMSDLEYRVILPDGGIRWIRDHSYPVFNAAGEVERVVGTARDISKGKLADLALASINRAMQMLSRSSIAINRIDDEINLLAEVCRVAVDMGGYRMAWVGYAQDDERRSIQPMAHAGDERGYLASIDLSWRDDEAIGQGPSGRAIRSGQHQQNSNISTDETFFWQESALQRGYRSSIALPLRSAGKSFGVLCLYRGEVEYFVPDEIRLLQELADNLAFGIDSLRARLERDRSQEAARQAAVKLREQASLLDRAQDAIMVRNLDGTLRFWNKGAERLYGWTAEEVLGKTMDGLMYRSPQVLTTVMSQTLASGGDWACELEQVTRDGSPMHVQTRATLVRDEHGQVNGMLGINTDIRDRKRAHEEILRLNASLEERVQQRTAQLEFSNQQLEAFSYSVSHDLRSPLSVIGGFSNLLEKTMAKAGPGDPHAERSLHYLARIRAGVGQMSELIDAMLSLAQVSRSSLLWQPVDLSALAEALLISCQEREPDRATQLRVEPGLLAQGDPRLLKQVLDNLLGNAWKFSAGRDCTEITVGHEKSSTGESVFFVRDKGAGFDMAYAEKLFGVFQRLHTADEFAGTGVGLATVQRIVARHGGRVWAESAAGQGATFYFTLGVAPAG